MIYTCHVTLAKTGLVNHCVRAAVLTQLQDHKVQKSKAAFIICAVIAL